MSNVKKPHVIVVGIDYSEHGELALAQALEVAATRPKAELHAVNVVSFIPPGLWVGYAPQAGPPGMPIEQAKEELQRYVSERLAAPREKRGSELPLARVFAHIRVGAPAEEIAQLATDLEADLVVVGTHGRRGAVRLLLGSVAEGVARLAPCPVLVVREKKLAPVVAIEPPCPECVKTREATNGERMWCEQHSQRHGQRHTYYQPDRISADGGMPLVFRT